MRAVLESGRFVEGERIPGTVYRTLGLIGQGGMGSVYKVEHVELGRVFVLKALHKHLSARSDLVGRMRNEWRALARLNHPNIVQVTDAGQTAAGLPFFVMENLEGLTLAQMLSSQGRLPLHQACSVMVDVLYGLGAAHKTGAIHRDIKPPNLFVTTEGPTKLLDFGIAKLRDRAARVVTAGGVSIGTPRYMAPEQAEGTKVDGRADIYSSALVLFECLVGRGPFDHICDPNELVMAHIGEEPERVEFLCPSVPPELGDLVQRWLSKSPNSRPLTAEHAARELASLAEALPADEESGPAGEVTVSGSYEASTFGGAVPQSTLSGTSEGPLLSAKEGAETCIKDGSGHCPTETVTGKSGERNSRTCKPSTLTQAKSARLRASHSPSPQRSAWYLVGGATLLAFVLGWGAVVIARPGFQGAGRDGAEGPTLPQLKRRAPAAQGSLAAALPENTEGTRITDSVERGKEEEPSFLGENEEVLSAPPMIPILQGSGESTNLGSAEEKLQPSPESDAKGGKLPTKARRSPASKSSTAPPRTPGLPSSGLW